MSREPDHERALRDAADALAQSDAHLADILREHGYPPLWRRDPGFPTLLFLIVEQQVSLESARATFGRLEQRLGAVTPEAFLGLDDAALRAIGFSRQKTRYGRELARALVERRLVLDDLLHLPDEEARAALVALPGIGPWTADNYLLMVLCRPDVWPSGDVALQAAAQRAKGLSARPTAAQLDVLAEPWRPYRSTAARLLWLQYLNESGRFAAL